MAAFVQAVDITGPGTSITYASDNDTWTINPEILVASTGGDAVVSAKNSSVLLNLGTVASGAAGAVNFDGDSGSITNAIGATMVGFARGIRVNGNGTSIDNDGEIRGMTQSGVLFGAAAANHSLDNSGDIFGHAQGVYDLSNAVGGVIANSGAIRSDQFGVSAFTTNFASTTIVNKVGGLIQGLVAAVETHNAGAISLTNRGLLKGIVNFDAGNENDVVRNFQNIQGQVFLGSGNDIYNGPSGTAGKIFGEDGVDKLYGGSFTDRFNGGLGNDLLVGRGARDVFFFDTAIFPVANIDTINGFTPGLDKIVVDDDIFVGIGPVGPLAAGRFVNGPAFTTPAQRFDYNPFNGFVFYDANGSTGGGNGPIAFARLTPGLAVSNFDFIVSA